MSAVAFVGEVGLPIRLDTATDIGDATGFKVLAQKPGGTVVEWTAGLDPADTTDQTILYTTIAGDLSVAGLWTLQGKVTTATAVRYTEKVTLEVQVPLAVAV